MKDYDYSRLHTHLLVTHQNLAAPSLGDGAAVAYHHQEHFGPGGLRNHMHDQSLPPINWSEIPLADDPYLTVAEVATKLRLSKMTIYRLVQNGELKAHHIGRSYRIRLSSLTAYLEREENQP